MRRGRCSFPGCFCSWPFSGPGSPASASSRNSVKVLSILLVCVLSLGMAAASYSMGLILKDEDSFAPMVQGVTLPLLLLSGVLLPMALAPSWLRHASQVNPLTYVVDGSRALFRGDVASSTTVKAVV